MNCNYMKKINLKFTLLIALMAFGFFAAKAQTLEETIAKNLPNLGMEKPLNELMGTMAQFDLAVGQYPEEWAANYYAAFAKATVSYVVKEAAQRDMLLDEADVYVAKAIELGANNSETFVVAAMVANARLAVDGQNRWQKYGALFSENLEKAKALNADNPRIYYLKGTSLFYTPEMFGGGKKVALPFFEQAKPLFAKENKGSVLIPHWGSEPNDYFISECNKTDEEPIQEEPKGKKEKKKKNE
ncbi:MAG: hypothetical protein IPN95_31070 [Bacteroidetes bacterium]|nr:hypothetical protein [Bacteroidota bacterium]MBL0018285.1 hypothetical protein [Bacteroidota bacterium]